MHDVAAICGNVHVRPLAGGSGLSSGTEPHPKPKDVRLTIRIQAPPAPGERRQIIVEQHVGPGDHNKALLTLLAALAILLVACGVAYAVRRRREPGASG